MRELGRFREAVEQYRKQVGRTEEDLARELYISKGELNKRLHDYHHPLSRRSWRLKPEDVFKIVETLARWGAITTRKQAITLFTLIEYPFLQEIDWQTSPWSRLHTDIPMPAPLIQEQQEEEAQHRAQEKTLYLQHVIQVNHWLILPGGREVPLERIYVSLRASNIQAKERRAEHALYLQELTTLGKKVRARITNPYKEFAAMRKAIARQPKKFMFDKRNWPKYVDDREQQTLTLAEVIQRQRQVVILGDPGSGKTTLGKWLVLQFAHALQRDDTQVRVYTHQVRSGEETAASERGLDLGPARLPVFVSIPDYARARRPRGEPDRGLTLYEFLESGLFLDRVPRGLSRQAAGTLVSEAVRQGQALVILDGLDEVGDTRLRRKVLEAVRRFLQEWCPAKSSEILSEDGLALSSLAHPTTFLGNQVIITSRIVGYQFDPLADIPHYIIEEMDNKAITAFCYAWIRHVVHPEEGKEEQSRIAEQLRKAIFSDIHPGVRSMAGNPLLLTIIAQLSWDSHSLDGLRPFPTRRVALFEEAARIFYDQREAFWDQAQITPLRLTRAFGVVAAALHASETAGLATEGEVRRQLRSVLSDEEQVEAVLSAARDVSGFLVARGEGVYGFLHRAFQEYFAANFLVSQPDQMIDNLVTRLLNPIWREPVILAISLVSRPKHPEHARLPELFAAILDASDLDGERLLQRDLLCVEACAECEVIPEGVGRRLATSLLSYVTQNAGQNATDTLRTQIQQAFIALQKSPSRARAEAEAVLCAAVQAGAFALRYTATDVIIETRWDSRSIAKALVAAWNSYADPAGSLLVALQRLHERQPGYFHAASLPFKQRMMERPGLWERAKARPEWESVLRILYLPLGADAALDQVNRDSPLTELVVATLEQQDSTSQALDRLRQQLHGLVRQPGSADSRDASLLLSALGDTNWIEGWRTYTGDQEYLIRPTVSALSFFGIHAVALVFALVRTRDFNRANDLDIPLAHNLAHTGDLARDLGFPRDLDLDLPLTRVRNLVRAFDRAGSFDLTHDVLVDLERDIEMGRSHWGEEPDKVHEFDVILSSINVLKKTGGWLQSIADTWCILVRTLRK